MRVLRSKASVVSFLLQGVFRRTNTRADTYAQVFPLSVSCLCLCGGLSSTRRVICEVDEAKVLSYLLPSIWGVAQCVRECWLTAVFSLELTNASSWKLHFYTSNNAEPASRWRCVPIEVRSITVAHAVTVHIIRNTCDEHLYIYLTASAPWHPQATQSLVLVHFCFADALNQNLCNVGGWCNINDTINATDKTFAT